MERRKNEKAITIIALVITIIVLLLLAGISIVTLTGQNGIIRKASESKEQNLIKSYEEQLDLIWQGVKVENIDKNLTYQELLEVAKSKIEEDKNFEGARVEIVDDIIVVTVKEGYIFHIIEGKAQWVGKEGEEKGTITAKLTTSEVQNKKTVFTATVEGAKGRKLTYILYINEEEKQREETYKTTINFKEQATRFGEDLTAYVKIEYGEEHPSTSNEVIVEDNTIATKEELKKFRDNVNDKKMTYQNKKIELIDDIDLQGSDLEQWIPIGNTSDVTTLPYFEGTFEGNGHILSGLYINKSGDRQGLFGTNKGNIQNVKMKDSYVKNLGLATGMLVGRNSGGIIQNIEILNGQVIGKETTGGIVGTVAEEGKVINCINYANVSYDTTNGGNYGWKMGGIVGLSLDKKTIVERCINKGEIRGTYMTGGIIGMNNEGNISECINTKTVKGEKDVMTNGGAAGGIAGVNGWGGTGTISNCYNIGVVDAKRMAGGIVGLTGGENGNCVIENCYNVGEIIVGTTFKGYKGGIVAYKVPDYATDRYTLTNNYWLSTCGTEYGIGDMTQNTNAEPKTIEEMKKLDVILGDSFKADEDYANNGYPVLKWLYQESI